MTKTDMRPEYQQYFSERFKEHGADVHTLWGSELSQRERFAVLCEVGDLGGSSVLDVGCGFGDLLGFVNSRGIQLAEYLGVDCVEDILAVARQRYRQGRFENKDVAALPDGASFDYVFGSGIFFLEGEQWHAHIIGTIRQMYARARVAVAVNFLSRFSTNRDAHSHYVDPGELLTALMDEITPIAELRHSYRSNDLTVFLYREWRHRS
jgi:trans-aconitate methyltransferase